jgi:hypothetical protein
MPIRLTKSKAKYPSWSDWPRFAINFSEEISELEATADELRDRGRSDHSHDPESSRITQSESDEDFDMHGFFEGLLDR